MTNFENWQALAITSLFRRPIANRFKRHSKKNTVSAYQAIIERFIQEIGDGPVERVTPEQILTLLNRLTEENKTYT